MDENKPQKILRNIPDVVKGWLGLIIAIAGIIIAIRTDQQLYVVVLTGIFLAIWLSTAIYIIFSHLPGTFSKKGIYRYEPYRWAAFISIGFVTGFIFSFSLFAPNRSYVSEVFIGTPTPTTSPTLIFYTATTTLTPSPTMTETPLPTPTPAPIIMFQEDFLNNNNGWVLPSGSYQSSYSPKGKIIGGKLDYSLFCTLPSPYDCENWLQIPHITAKNFDLMFDSKITYTANNASLLDISVKFRNVAGMYYIIYFSHDGTISVSLFENGLNNFIAKNVFSKNINQGLNETNHFRLVVQDSVFTIYANEQEITRIEDGNNSSIGSISLGISLPQQNGNATVEIDNIQIHEVH